MIRVVLLMISLASGGGAAWLALALRHDQAATNRQQVSQPPPMPTAEILVAAKQINRGETLSADHLRWETWPASAANQSLVTKAGRPDAVEALTGSVLNARVVAGEPIRDGMLRPLGTGLLSSTLASGRRAVAVKITAENTAGGFILPNDRVDVISIVPQDTRAEGDKRHMSRTILTNIPVLAIDQSAEQRDREEKGRDDGSRAQVSVIGRTATLEVTSPQAEILSAAEASGMLSLVLRSANDNDDRQAVAPPLETTAVRVIRGGRVEMAATR